jgi:hypothetical protein
MENNPEILLHPNIPKPLHGLAPRVIKGQSWWDEKRKAAYFAADYKCEACGVKKQNAKYHQWLEAHELYEMDYPNGKMIFKRLVALCHSCHNYIHSGRLQMLLNSGKISQKKYDDIISHGDNLLEKYNIKKKTYKGKVAEWEDWRLVFEGKEYKGKFYSFEEWEDFYRNS